MEGRQKRNRRRNEWTATVTFEGEVLKERDRKREKEGRRAQRREGVKGAVVSEDGVWMLCDESGNVSENIRMWMRCAHCCVSEYFP